MTTVTITGPALRLVQGPAVEPITRALVKSVATVDADLTEHDELIDILIAAARAACEHETGRRLITQQWDVIIDAFPLAEIEIPLYPVQAVVSVTYIDAAGAPQTLDNALYTLDTSSESAPFLLAAEGAQWPTTLDTAAAVTIRVRCGYGDTAADVPATARAWMAIHAAEQVPGSDVKLTEHVHRSLDGLRVWSA